MDAPAETTQAHWRVNQTVGGQFTCARRALGEFAAAEVLVNTASFLTENISRFGDKIIGVGGFINISQNAKCVIFSGTLTAGGLDVAYEDGQTVIRREGQHRKFVNSIEQICYSAAFARERGQTALYITERAMFRLGDDGLELIEIAPGVDVERDVIGQMAFRPRISSDLKTMDARLFYPPRLDVRDEIVARGRRYRSERVARWYAEQQRRTGAQ